MPDGRLRLERELFLSAFGVGLDLFDDWVLDRLTTMVGEQHVQAGQRLWSAGEPIESLYFMPHGKVRMTREGAAPWTFDGRWFLGGFDGHLERGASRTAVAVTDFDSLILSRRAWLNLLEDSFELTRQSISGSATAVALLDERRPSGHTMPWQTERVPALPDAPLDAIDVLAFTAELGSARGAGIQTLVDLAAASHELSLEEGALVFSSSRAGEDLFLVMNGRVEARRKDPDLARFYGPGDLVAGPAAFSERIRHWEARALGPARLLVTPVEAWFDLMEVHFGFARFLMGTLATWREKILDALAESRGPEGIVLT